MPVTLDAGALDEPPTDRRDPPCRRYNSSLPEGLGARITARGAARGAATTVLVGNSRSLWDHFLEACERDEGLLASGNPLDRYVETSLVAALAAACPG